MKEVSKARLLCGVFSIALLLYQLFVSLPDFIETIKYLNHPTIIKLATPLILQIGLYSSLALWSLIGILKFEE